MTESTPRKSRKGKINLRMILFAAVVLAIVGYPFAVYLRSEWTQGVGATQNGYTEVDFKALVTFEFDQNYGRVEDIPARWRALDGKQIALTGEIAQISLSAMKVGEFDLVYSNMQCCFTGKPLIQHFVKSRMADGSSAPYSGGPVKAWGVLHVDVKNVDGKVATVYRFDVNKIEPLS